MSVVAIFCFTFFAAISSAAEFGPDARTSPPPSPKYAPGPSIHFKDKTAYSNECTAALVASNTFYAHEFLRWSEVNQALLKNRDEFELALAFKVDFSSLFDRPTNTADLFGLSVAPGLLRIPEFNSVYKGEVLSIVYGPTSSWFRFIHANPGINQDTQFRFIDLRNSEDLLAQQVNLALFGERRSLTDRDQNLALIMSILTRFNVGKSITIRNGLKDAIMAVVDSAIPASRREAVKIEIEAQTQFGPNDGLKLNSSVKVQIEFRKAISIIGEEFLMTSDRLNSFSLERQILARAAFEKWSDKK